MRIGLIARADTRGLGIQTRAFHDHMHPAKTLVVNCQSAKPLPIRRDWYPNATWVDHWPRACDYSGWLTNLDVVYTAETPYSHSLFSTARDRGIRTVLHVNPEFLDHMRKPYLPKPTLFAAPSTWMYDQLPGPKALLPVPVATEHFTPQAADRATNFLHVVGRPAIHDRAGTADLLLALESVHTDITVTITCQEPGYVHSLIGADGIKLPDNVELIVADGDVDNYWDLYTGHHVLVSPRRFGGLSLPMQEACAAGMPVIAPAVSPTIDWLPNDWLIPATHAGSFVAHTTVDLYTTDAVALAAKIDQMASDPAYYRDASARALGIAKQLSWAELKPEYERVLR
jgi:glycosyltransferase involved in cell wall biosynthesis